MAKFAKGNNSKKIKSVNTLTILYQLTKFEIHSYYNFWDILIMKFYFGPLKGK